MGHPTGLARLAFATRNEPIPTAMRPIRDPVTTAPELRRDPMVDDITNHVGSLPVLDQPECVAAELEVISSLIDAIGPVAFNVDAPLHIGEQLIEGGGAGFEADVGNANDRDAAPAVCPIRPARARLADCRRHLAVRAIPDEKTVTHNVPLLAGHAIVVVAGCGESLRFAVICYEIYVPRAVSKCSSFLGREKAGTGIVGLVPSARSSSLG